PGRRDLIPHLAVLGANTAYRGLHEAITIGDRQPLHSLETRMTDIVRIRLDEVNVFLLEDNLLTGALSSGLFAGLLRPANHATAAKGVESAHGRAADSAAVGDQQRDGDDAPHDAEHRECGTGAATQERVPGVADDLEQHRYPPASCRSASIGSMIAARRAG